MQTNKPTVAVTGGSGFVGNALVRHLAGLGYPVRVLNRDPGKFAPVEGVDVVTGDLADPEALKRLTAGADTVYHIASMFRTEGAADEFDEINYKGTMNLFAAAEAAGVRRFVHCSTIGVHGNVMHTPADETSPFNPRDPYQDSKLKAELAVRAAAQDLKMQLVVIRPCSTYGPGDVRLLKIFRMVQKGVFFFVGSGKPNIHPVYIDDLVRGYVLAMTTPAAAGEVFIIGQQSYLPLREFINAAARSLGAKQPWIRIPYGPMNALARVCEIVFPKIGMQPPLHRRRLTFYKHNRAFSIEKARRLLGYEQQISLDEGFRRTVDWYYETGLLSRKG